MNRAEVIFILTTGCIAAVVQAATIELQPKYFVAGAFSSQQVDGTEVWVPDNPQSVLHFDVPAGLPFVQGQPVYVQIQYHDSGSGRLFVEYDSTYGASATEIYYDAEIHTRSSRVGSGQFVHAYQMFESPVFGNRQTGQTDFRMRVVNGGSTPFRVASVVISTEVFADPQFQYAVSSPWLQPYTDEPFDLVDAKSLRGKVLTGYQGWFSAPNDLMDRGWNHWGRSRDVDPSPTEITIDMWPYIDDYRPENLYPAGEMRLKDGRPAYLFSSSDPDTVRTHFRWMRQYNIDGVYLQRFVTRNNSGYYGAREFVLHNVRQAAREQGRVWAIEYDISSLASDPDPLLVMQNDWNWLVNEAGILEDPRYLHENGKPVLFIWGFSVNGREFTLAQANEIVDWFRAQDLYLLGGVPNNWEDKTDWHGHYRRYDQLLGWMEGSPSELSAERQLLESWGMKLLPHAWPGFSWANLKKQQPDQQYTARRRGSFYWERLRAALQSGADQLFLGMFDEYDEATAIMPMSDNHPEPHTEWGNYITNAGRDPFWWLALSGLANEMLKGVRPFNTAEPLESEVAPPAYVGAHATVFLGPDNDERGLRLVSFDDGLSTSAVFGRQPCRVNVVNPDAASYLYFDIDDDFVPGAPGSQNVMIEIEVYVTEPDTSVRLQYDTLGSNYQLAAAPVAFPKPDTWTTVRWFVRDAAFQNGQNGPADFRLNIAKGKAAAVRRVSVFLPEPSDETLAAIPASPLRIAPDSLSWSDRLDAVGWRLYQSPNLAPGSWAPVPDAALSFLNGSVVLPVATNAAPQFFSLLKDR